MRWLIAAALMCMLLGPARAVAADWSRPTVLDPTPPTFELDRVTSAANARGDAVVVWERSRVFADGVTCCDDHRVLASYRPAGGTFGKPEGISRLGDEATGPAVGIDAAGNVVAAWTVNSLEANFHFRVGAVGAAFRPAGAQHFDSPQRIDDKPGEPVVVAAGAPGEAVVAWEELAPDHGLNHPERVMAAVQSGPGTLSKPMPVSAINEGIVSDGSLQYPMPMELTAAADRAGTTYLAWLRADGTSSTCCTAVEATRRGAGGGFETPVAASPPGLPTQVYGPRLSASAAGALLAWARAGDQPDICCRTLVARDWPSAGELGPPTETDLGGSGSIAALDLLEDGSARALAVTLNPESTDYEESLLSMTRAPGGPFGAPQSFALRVGAAGLVSGADGSTHALLEIYTKDRCDRYGCEPTAPRIYAADAPPGGSFGAPRAIIGRRSRGSGPTISAVGGGAIASWSGSRGPAIAALGTSPGPAPIATVRRGPVLSHFARSGRRRFTFRTSKPATVLLEVARGYERADVVGQVTVTAAAGKGTIAIPRELAAKLQPRTYVLTLIATDAVGHDSAAIKPIRLRFAGG